MLRKILLSVVLTVLFAVCTSNGDERPEPSLEGSGGDNGDARPVVLFLGTSLTAGYGLDPSRAYPSLIQRMIDSAGFSYRVVNAGESGATSAGGVRRIGWLMQQPVEVLVLELGANDGLRGYDPATTKHNLAAIIDSARAVKPDIVVMVTAMEAPPNLGPEYTSTFRNVFPEVAAEKGAVLVPFLLDGVAGITRLNQADGIHPTAEGQKRLAVTVWSQLSAVLESLSLE